MRDIAKLNENDKKALFHNTAAKMGMTDAIIEKDFWVCYILLLDEFDYPPVTIDDVYKEVLEQAGNFKKYAN